MTEPGPELSRPVPVERIGSARHTVRIVADAVERAALAQRFGIVAIDRLEATATLRRIRAGQLIEVALSLSADVTQTCVVTLDPVAQSVTETLTLRFGPTGGAEGDRRGAAASEVDIGGLDEPEPLDGPELDVGELVAQQLSLALDPYPRHPEAADAEPLVESGGDAEPSVVPLAGLAAWKPRQPS